MAGVINTGSFPKLLWPGVNKTWGLSYQLYDNGAQWKDIYDQSKSDKSYEEDVGQTGLGLIPIKFEGDSTSYDSMKQGFVSRYTNVTYALGYIVTQEEIEDNKYPKTVMDRARNLAFVTNQTREIVGANVLNRAFNAGFAGGDGVSLLNALHPIENGTFSNTLAVAADLSEASIEQLIIDAQGSVDNRGNTIAIQPQKLIIPRQLQFDAERIMMGKERTGTADRDINAMYKMGSLPEGFVVNQYLDDADAWFFKTNCPDGMKYFDRIATSFTGDNDYDTDNLKYKCRSRYVFGWTDPRGLWGSPGA